MPIYDISLPITESLAPWPDQPPVRLTTLYSLERGNDATVTGISMSTHTGTHVDAPGHFIRGGRSVDSLDLSLLIGPALVVHLPKVDELTRNVLASAAIPAGVERVLFRTRNSDRWAFGLDRFVEDYAAITEDGARFLVERGVRLIGMDYHSVAPFSDPGPTHRVLLGADVILLEGLDLSAVAPGTYELVCLPLNIMGSEDAPARAVLIG